MSTSPSIRASGTWLPQACLAAGTEHSCRRRSLIALWGLATLIRLASRPGMVRHMRISWLGGGVLLRSAIRRLPCTWASMDLVREYGDALDVACHSGCSLRVERRPARHLGGPCLCFAGIDRGGVRDSGPQRLADPKRPPDDDRHSGRLWIAVLDRPGGLGSTAFGDLHVDARLLVRGLAIAGPESIVNDPAASAGERDSHAQHDLDRIACRPLHAGTLAQP